jgi:16S rRNA (uracil1498-N3)-methyltransferase
MEISQAVGFGEFVQWEVDGAERWIAQPSDARGGASQAVRSQAEPGNENALVVAIGPEGGFTDEEVRLAIDAGFVAVDFGPRILRVETAAIAVAAQVALACGEVQP